MDSNSIGVWEGFDPHHDRPHWRIFPTRINRENAVVSKSHLILSEGQNALISDHMRVGNLIPLITKIPNNTYTLEIIQF